MKKICRSHLIHMFRFSFIPAILVVFSFIFAPSTYASDNVTNLGNLGGSHQFYTDIAWDINNQGQIVGQANTNPNQNPSIIHAFLYENGQMTMLNLPNSSGSSAIDINNIGQIVGVFRDAMTEIDHGYLYENGQVTVLDCGVYIYCSPRSINDNGVISGEVSDGENQYAAYYENNHWTRLSKLGKDYYLNTAYKINTNHQIAGKSNRYAAMWTYDANTPEDNNPVVNTFSVSQNPVYTGSSVSATATFSDQDTSDTHTSVVDWGDGTNTIGILTENAGSGTVASTHTYTDPGTYTVKVLVYDNAYFSGFKTYDVTVQTNPQPVTVTDNGNNWGNTGRTIDVHRLLSTWVEGNGKEASNDRGSGSGATWACAIDSNIANQQTDCNGTTAWEMGQPNNPSVHPWAQTASDTKTITNNQTGVVEFDVTNDVVSFLNGTNENYGWLIKKTAEAQNGQVSFGTKESSSVPQLVVTYQP